MRISSPNQRWAGFQKTTEEFHLVVSKAVDEGLLVLGASVKDSMYYYLEKNRQVRREEIPSKITAFHEALESLLGAGAKVLERLIAERLYSRLNLIFEERENWTLGDYVRYAQKAKKGGG